MASMLKWASSLVRRQPLAPRVFSAANIPAWPQDTKLEEETIPGYEPSRYYPVRIGEVFKERYQVVGKLGYGVTSTVWLARDLNRHNHVTLKVYVHDGWQGKLADHEISMYERIAAGPESHLGKDAVRALLEHFQVPGPDGAAHKCLVHPPLWNSMRHLRATYPGKKLDYPILQIVLKRLLQALDYLHTECSIIHADIKEDNIMFGLGGGSDDPVLAEYEAREMRQPSHRKEVDGRTIYLSRPIPQPANLGPPVLADFGSAILGNREHTATVQPKLYRSPESLLGVPWTYSIDIWNSACIIWDILQGKSLFSGVDPEFKTYRSRQMVAEMIAMLGPPPPSLLARGCRSSQFFTNAGDFNTGIEIPPAKKMGDIGYGAEQEQLLELTSNMLRWVPEDRMTAKQLLGCEIVKAQMWGPTA